MLPPEEHPVRPEPPVHQAPPKRRAVGPDGEDAAAAVSFAERPRVPFDPASPAGRSSGELVSHPSVAAPEGVEPQRRARERHPTPRLEASDAGQARAHPVSFASPRRDREEAVQGFEIPADWERHRWPDLPSPEPPEEEPEAVSERMRRAWRRAERLDQEQRGRLWSA